MITIDDFAKIEMTVGTVVECAEVEGSEKLLQLTVDLGEETPRNVFSGIKRWYSPEDLKGKQFVFVTNLEPRKMMGSESQAMIMTAAPIEEDGTMSAVPLILSKEVPNGTKIR
jgi:methionyl-tRNA synthetase